MEEGEKLAWEFEKEKIKEEIETSAKKTKLVGRSGGNLLVVLFK